MELETLVHNFRKAIEAAQANYELASFLESSPPDSAGIQAICWLNI